MNAKHVLHDNDLYVLYYTDAGSVSDIMLYPDAKHPFSRSIGFSELPGKLQLEFHELLTATANASSELHSTESDDEDVGDSDTST